MSEYEMIYRDITVFRGEGGDFEAKTLSKSRSPRVAILDRCFYIFIGTHRNRLRAERLETTEDQS